MKHTLFILAALAVISLTALALPVQRPAQAQEPPTKPPLVEPTKPPVVEPTKAPAVEPTKAPVEQPTQPPVDAPTTPSGPPTQSVGHGQVQIEQLTLTPTALPTRAPTTTATTRPTSTPTRLATVTNSALPTSIPVTVRAGVVNTTRTVQPVDAGSASPTPTSTPTAAPTPTQPTGLMPGTSAGIATPLSVAAPTVGEAIGLLPVVELSSLLLTLGGGLALIAAVLWIALNRMGNRLLTAYRLGKIAELRQQHEAERVARRDKVAPHEMSDVRALLEQSILDATGERVDVLKIREEDVLLSPPLLGVIGSDGRRYAFSPLSAARLSQLRRDNARVSHLLLSETPHEWAVYPLDALNSTPFIADDLQAAFLWLTAKFQRPRVPLPRGDQWTLCVVTPRRRQLADGQTIVEPTWLRRVTGRLLLPGTAPADPTISGDYDPRQHEEQDHA